MSYNYQSSNYYSTENRGYPIANDDWGQDWGQTQSSDPYYASQQQGFFQPQASYNPDVNFQQFEYDTTGSFNTKPDVAGVPPFLAPAPNNGNYSGSMFVPGSMMDPKAAGRPGSENFDDEPPLLEELGINFDHIWQKTLSVLNPFKITSQQVLQDTDLAGPLVFCLAFGGTLLLVGKLHFGYIYGLGIVGCLAMYALLSMMSPMSVSLTFIMSTLGYCLLPMCVLSACAIFLTLKGPFGLILTAIVVFWCSFASSKLFVTALNMDHQRFLVGYPCALVYGVFALLTVF